MKKLLGWVLFLGIVAALGLGAYLWYYAPERVACDRLATLCELDAADEASCVETLDGAADEELEALQQATRCIVSAESCIEAVGCGVGAGLGVGAGAAGDFLKGVQRALE